MRSAWCSPTHLRTPVGTTNSHQILGNRAGRADLESGGVVRKNLGGVMTLVTNSFGPLLEIYLGIGTECQRTLAGSRDVESVSDEVQYRGRSSVGRASTYGWKVAGSNPVVSSRIVTRRSSKRPGVYARESRSLGRVCPCVSPGRPPRLWSKVVARFCSSVWQSASLPVTRSGVQIPSGPHGLTKPKMVTRL